MSKIINLLKMDLARAKVVNQVIGDPHGRAYWQLTPLGWDIVRLEMEKRKKAAHKQMDLLVEALKGYPGKSILEELTEQISKTRPKSN